MKIRFATAADVDSLLVLGRAMHEESRFARYPMNEAKVREMVLTMLQEPKVNGVLVAQNSTGELVGMLAVCVLPLFFTDTWIAQDRWFYVAQAHRGSSAALKLLMAFKQWAVNRQVKELNINMSVDIDQVKFNRFMTNMGFTSTGSNFMLSLVATPNGIQTASKLH